MKTKSFFHNKQFNIIFTMRHATRGVGVGVGVVAKKQKYSRGKKSKRMFSSQRYPSSAYKLDGILSISLTAKFAGLWTYFFHTPPAVITKTFLTR